MSAERPDFDPTNGGNGPELPVWRTLWVILVSAVLIGLLARGLYLALDLPQDSHLARPAIMISVINAIFARPMTYRQIATATAVGVLVGAVALLSFLPVMLHIQSYELPSQRFMIQFLGLVLIVAIGFWACLRFWTSVRDRATKDPF